MYEQPCMINKDSREKEVSLAPYTYIILIQLQAYDAYKLTVFVEIVEYVFDIMI